jgi:hypothetical protein
MFLISTCLGASAEAQAGLSDVVDIPAGERIRAVSLEQ